MDTMAVDIGVPGAAVQRRTMTDDDDRWRTYTGVYTVPAGQATTRFAFRSVSAERNAPNYGNLLDDVSLRTAPCVLVDKSAGPRGPVNVGDVITYRLTAVNNGGGAADNVRLTDTVPAGTTLVQ
ncbi:DUF11 domain-containing protein, partial [Nonomuraea sp. RK-328]|nr:DUF11 domain-containing protein [Nonomuraea sp. RK-328]